MTEDVSGPGRSGPADAGGRADLVRVRGSYEFTAPAEVVFGVLTDPHRMSRWLPREMESEDAGAGRVRVRAGADLHEFGVEVVADELRVRWYSPEPAGLRGAARVSDAAAGGSVIDAEVDVPGADRDRARSLLAEAMRHLQRDVSDNFNAG